MKSVSFIGGMLGGLGALTAAASMLVVGSAAAEGLPAPKVQVSDKVTADALAGKFSAYIMPVKGYAGSRLIGQLPAGRAKVPTLTFDLQGNIIAAAGATLTSYYPDDMGYYGGPVLAGVTQVNFYFANNSGSIWGNPAVFEAALNTSTMVELLDLRLNPPGLPRRRRAGFPG